ncbi:ATP-binding cassette domain-containing protein [Pseudochrobactrum sp. MP213Fo]|uniref:ATP-binding cassette domain-containing protein n=1 Tax=Pseudochrobactrum sp. MP213Fo TaxID=3022250 RepID=UPI003B9FFDEC
MHHSTPSKASPNTATKTAVLLRLDNAGIEREGRWLVRNISLDLHKGEIVTLIGPNGSGKSTTAKLALGIHKPDEGRVTREKALTIGYVPQKISIDPSLPLTVERMMCMTKPQSKATIDDALAMAGIPHLITAQIAHLSGGEFQRVLLARAFACKPDLLVLDEPLQGVDFAGEAELYERIAGFRDQTGCGVLMISHDLHIVMAATDRVICLNGHICCSGTPVDVAASPEYAKLFGLRTPRGQEIPTSIAVYTHHHDHMHLADGRVQHTDGSVTDHCHHDDGSAHHHADKDEHKHV